MFVWVILCCFVGDNSLFIYFFYVCTDRNNSLYICSLCSEKVIAIERFTAEFHCNDELHTFQ